MPFHLPNFYGGLGNQLFSIVTMYSLSKKYNTTFSIDKNNTLSTGFVTNNVYFSVFQCLIQSNSYLDKNDTLPVIHYTVEQFKDYDFDTTLAHTHTIYLSGLPMKYSLFESYIDDIISIYHQYKQSIYPSLLQNIPRLCIAIRRFTSENSTHWATSMEYYKKAIQYMSSYYKTCTIHIYTDTLNSSELIMPFIKDNFGDTVIDIKEFVGSKESGSDIIHLFEMFDYDNYILCNSTYHYWSALLTTYANAIVTYPMDCEWYKHIASNKWIGIQ